MYQGGRYDGSAILVSFYAMLISSPEYFAIVFTGSGDGCMRAYSAMSGELKVTYDGHEGAVNCMLLLDNKSYTGSSDCTLRCWDTRELW